MDDDLHVLISGETEEDVDLAEKLVRELLVPIDDELNVHKQKQLRELALINGTLREEPNCTICGQKGHQQFECTNRRMSYSMANVVCAICGDASHVTADCKYSQGVK